MAAELGVVGFLLLAHRIVTVLFAPARVIRKVCARVSRSGTATDVDGRLGLRTAIPRLRLRRRLGGEPLARRTLLLPDQFGHPCGVGQRHGRGVGLVPGNGPKKGHPLDVLMFDKILAA